MQQLWRKVLLRCLKGTTPSSFNRILAASGLPVFSEKLKPCLFKFEVSLSVGQDWCSHKLMSIVYLTLLQNVFPVKLFKTLGNQGLIMSSFKGGEGSRSGTLREAVEKLGSSLGYSNPLRPL